MLKRAASRPPLCTTLLHTQLTRSLLKGTAQLLREPHKLRSVLIISTFCLLSDNLSNFSANPARPKTHRPRPVCDRLRDRSGSTDGDGRTRRSDEKHAGRVPKECPQERWSTERLLDGTVRLNFVYLVLSSVLCVHVLAVLVHRVTVKRDKQLF